MPAFDPAFLLASPRVVATIHRPEDLALVAAGSVAPDTCDVLEFRLDNLRDHLNEVDAAMSAAPFPCLITARHPDEGGAGNLSADRRRELLGRFLPLATYIDVEGRSVVDLADVVHHAKESGVGVIVSAHDFAGPMSQETLERISHDAFDADADVIKIAMMLDSMLDLSRLIVLTSTLASANSAVASMGMGPLGKISRLTLAAAGSCLNYGYLQEPNAPGQWPAVELVRLIAEIRA